LEDSLEKLFDPLVLEPLDFTPAFFSSVLGASFLVAAPFLAGVELEGFFFSAGVFFGSAFSAFFLGGILRD
jgi:hypothetical protein